MNLLVEVSRSDLEGLFNMPQNVATWANGVTSPPKEAVLRIFIALGRV
jgi:hypothetical protein